MLNGLVIISHDNPKAVMNVISMNASNESHSFLDSSILKRF